MVGVPQRYWLVLTCALGLPSLAAAQADLTVSVATYPSTGRSGANLTVAHTVENIGVSASGTRSVHFLLSTDTTITTSDFEIGSRTVGGLSAGGSSTEFTTVYLPTTFTGTWYIGVWVDRYDNEAESDETNNILVGPAISISPGADLVVSAITGPTAAVPEEIITVMVTVDNVGVGDARSNTLTLHLSADAVIDPVVDGQIDSFWLPNIAPGSSYTASITTAVWQTTAPGTWYMGAFVDRYDDQPETDENNNTFAGPTITISAGADLSVTALGVPATVTLGASFQVTYTITNSGVSGARSSSTHIHISTNPLVTTNDPEIIEFSVPSIPAGGSYTETGTAYFPSGSLPGTWYLAVDVDPHTSVYETDETNNFRVSVPFTVIEGADLTISSVVAPLTAPSGTSVDVTVSVDNVGVGDARSNSLHLFLSTDTVLDSGDSMIRDAGFPSLTRGSSTTVTESSGISSSLAPGSYFVLAEIDPHDQMPETDETNNLDATQTIDITPGADFVITAVTAPTDVVPGSTYPVTVTLTNQGPGTSGSSYIVVRASTNSNLTAADEELASSWRPGLSSGETLTDSFSLGIPGNAPAGTYYLGFFADGYGNRYETDEANNLYPPFAVTVHPAPAAVTFATPSPTVTAGTCSPQVRLEVVDASGLPVTAASQLQILLTSSSGTMDFFSDPGCTLQVGSTDVPALSNAAAFFFRDNVAGTPNIDADLSAVPIASQSVTVQADVAVVLELTGVPNPFTAGVGEPVTVTARDQFLNVAHGYIGLVGFVATDPAALLPSDILFTGAEQGQFTASGLEFRTAGLQTLTASDSAAGIGGALTDLLVLAGPATRVLLSPDDGLADACGTEDVALSMVDGFGNQLSGVAAEGIEVSLQVTSFEGNPTIEAVDLVGVGALPAVNASGTTGTNGLANVTTSLDSAGLLTLIWSSVALSGSPSGSIDIQFAAGGADPGASLVAADGTQIEAGQGSVAITVTPQDACGAGLGAGLNVTLRTTLGALTPVVDVGDGTYTSTFTTLSGECPVDPARIVAVVGGVVLDTTVLVTSRCTDIDPASPVAASITTLDACAIGGVWAEIDVTALSLGGATLPAGQSITIDEDPPRLIQGSTRSVTDAGTGITTYILKVGSDRCGGPRSVVIRVNGVALTTVPTLTFLCPAIDPGQVQFEVVPDVVTADGQSTAALTVTLLDTCGNRAFDRPIAITASNPSVPITVTPPSTRTADAPGQTDDGRAAFVVSSTEPGVTGLVATVGSESYTSRPDLLSFALDGSELSIAYVGPKSAVVGAEILLIATLTNLGNVTLTDVEVIPVHQGIGTVRVEGAEVDGDGKLTLANPIGPGESVELRLTARVEIGPGTALSKLRVLYGDPSTGGWVEAWSDELRVAVFGSSFEPGCECAGGGEPTGLLGLALLLGLLRRRRRCRPNLDVRSAKARGGHGDRR